MIKAVRACAALFLLLSAVAPPAAQAEEPRTIVSVLVDLSGTWLNERSRRLNQDVLVGVVEALVEISLRSPPPIAIRILPIADTSLFADALCQATFIPTLIPRKDEAGFFYRRDTLHKYLATDCPHLILSRKQSAFTDISGAIASAAETSKHVSGSDPILIILSDMVEDLPPKQERAAYDLTGFRVLVLYRTLGADQRYPGKQRLRLETWRQALLTAGASKVHLLPDQPLVASTLLRLLRE